MISNEGMIENSKIISIDDKSEYYNDKRYLLMRWLHNIYYYITNANKCLTYISNSLPQVGR